MKRKPQKSMEEKNKMKGKVEKKEKAGCLEVEVNDDITVRAKVTNPVKTYLEVKTSALPESRHTIGARDTTAFEVAYREDKARIEQHLQQVEGMYKRLAEQQIGLLESDEQEELEEIVSSLRSEGVLKTRVERAQILKALKYVGALRDSLEARGMKVPGELKAIADKYAEVEKLVGNISDKAVAGSLKY